MSEATRVERDAAFTSAGNRTEAHGQPDVGTEAIAGLIAQGLRVVSHDVALEQAEERARAAIDLLVNVTHDLRSPLSSMLVLLEQLRGGAAGPVSPQQERLLGVVYAATFSMAALTNDTLELARGSTGPEPSKVAAFSLRAVWQEVRALVQPIAEARGLLLRFAGPADDEREGHRGALHRVLLNLVTNALKHTECGAVTVCIESAGTDRLRFEVRDTGTGLPLLLRAQVNAYEAQGAVVLPPSGGMGLATCQRLLGVLGSRLEVLDCEGGAALAFTLALPPAQSRART